MECSLFSLVNKKQSHERRRRKEDYETAFWRLRGRLTGKMKQNYNNGLELLCTFVEIYLKTGLSESLFGFSPAAGLN